MVVQPAGLQSEENAEFIIDEKYVAFVPTAAWSSITKTVDRSSTLLPNVEKLSRDVYPEPVQAINAP